MVVSTLDKKGSIHNSCKGIVEIDSRGRIFLMDLYKARTFRNLQSNSRVSITSVDEHKFKGYCLKGKARIVNADELDKDILKAWEDKLTSRVSSRVLKNIRGEKGHLSHPEIRLPKPEYMISVDVEDVVDLTPHNIK